MKLSFIGDNDLPGVANDSRLAAQHGFAGIEYNFWGDFSKLTIETVRQMAGIHKEHGVKAAMLGTWGFNHLSQDAAEREQCRNLLDRQIEFAQVLKAEWIVTGCGDIPGEPVGLKIARFVEVFAPQLAKVKDAGLKIAFYAVHSNSFLDSLPAMERMWEVMPDLKLKYDPANWKAHGADYLEIARQYSHKIGYVHIKDHIYKDGHVVSEPPAGMGDIEFPKVLAYLYQAAYDGYLSIEPHGSHWGRGELRRKNILLSQRYIQSMLV